MFHLGSPLRVFERYLSESPYVGVGGMASGTLTMRDPRLWKYLDRLHGLAAAAKVGLHGFGSEQLAGHPALPLAQHRLVHTRHRLPLRPRARL